LVYKRDDSEQPFENDTCKPTLIIYYVLKTNPMTPKAFPPPQLKKSPLDQSVSLRDPWDGPSHFAEDFYSGGEVHQSSGTMLDPNHLSELDASSDIATFLTPGIMTPNIISSDNLPTPSAALLSQTFHPTEDGVMERVEELPDLGLQKAIPAPGYTVEDERKVNDAIDGKPSAPATLSEPLTVDLQDNEDLYHGLDNFIETLTSECHDEYNAYVLTPTSMEQDSTAHLAQTIQEQEPSVSFRASPGESQEDRSVNESSGKTLDGDNFTIEEFTEQRDTEVIDIDELDDTDELVKDEGNACVHPYLKISESFPGHTVASHLAEEASIRRAADDSPSITQTIGVFGNEGKGLRVYLA
jgi:hypothetical protein